MVVGILAFVIFGAGAKNELSLCARKTLQLQHHEDAQETSPRDWRLRLAAFDLMEMENGTIRRILAAVKSSILIVLLSLHFGLIASAFWGSNLIKTIDGSIAILVVFLLHVRLASLVFDSFKNSRNPLMFLKGNLFLYWDCQ